MSIAAPSDKITKWIGIIAALMSIVVGLYLIRDMRRKDRQP